MLLLQPNIIQEKSIQLGRFMWPFRIDNWTYCSGDFGNCQDMSMVSAVWACWQPLHMPLPMHQYPCRAFRRSITPIKQLHNYNQENTSCQKWTLSRFHAYILFRSKAEMPILVGKSHIEFVKSKYLLIDISTSRPILNTSMSYIHWCPNSGEKVSNCDLSHVASTRFKITPDGCFK